MKTFPVKKGQVIELGEGNSSTAKRDGFAYFDGDTVKMVPNPKQQPVAADLTDEQIIEAVGLHPFYSKKECLKIGKRVLELAALGSAPATPTAPALAPATQAPNTGEAK